MQEPVVNHTAEPPPPHIQQHQQQTLPPVPAPPPKDNKHFMMPSSPTELPPHQNLDLQQQPPTPPPQQLMKQEYPMQSQAINNASMPSLPSMRQSSLQSPVSPQTPSGSSSRSSASVANVPVGDQLLDHSHLKPGNQASLLSYSQTINMYRENAKKTNSPEVQCDFAIFMVEAAKPLTAPEDEQIRWEYLGEAEKLLKQLSSRGHAESQYYLGNLYASGILSRKGKNEFNNAFPLFVQATKKHHADAAYR